MVILLLQEDLINSSDYPRLMVITGFLPDGYSGGPVILRSFLGDYPAQDLCWCSLVKPPGYKLWWRNNIRKYIIPFRILGRWLPGVKWFLERFLYRIEGYVAARYALKIARKFKPQLCWIVLDFGIIFTAEHFIRKCRVPVHVSVHDDPVIAARFWNYGTPVSEIEKAFKFCLASARSADCISKRMSEHYKLLYNKNSMVLTRGIDCSRYFFRQNYNLGMNNEIKIILAGSSHLFVPWINNITSALKIIRSSHGMKIKFYIFDSKIDYLGDEVNQIQFMPDNEFDDFIQHMDIGFSIDPLTEIGRKLATRSFPTKVVTYLGYGKPFLYSGPSDSTVGDLLKTYEAGLITESFEPEKLAEGFLYIIHNYNAMRQECFRAAKECFEINMLRKKLMRQLIETAGSNIKSYKL